MFAGVLKGPGRCFFQAECRGPVLWDGGLRRRAAAEPVACKGPAGFVFAPAAWSRPVVFLPLC